ncbi:hypothetical protein DKX38_014441 [Salix brachista]|uniref:Uncharacterized protein n=1 Tax=Salix brachista TaxID=2182728 RepID=A0A5N5LFD6_9ROSI|nr:hypothetical protein DKX38_014441 [Salix brachista]
MLARLACMLASIPRELDQFNSFSFLLLEICNLLRGNFAINTPSYYRSPVQVREEVGRGSGGH